MPNNRKMMQRYYKITVHFKSGTKDYQISPEKFRKFITELKALTDVIHYSYKTIYSFIHK